MLSYIIFYPIPDVDQLVNIIDNTKKPTYGGVSLFGSDPRRFEPVLSLLAFTVDRC